MKQMLIKKTRNQSQCGGQQKTELILPCQKASFSGDAVECLLLSRKLSNSERGEHLDGCPLHVRNGGNVMTECLVEACFR
jgi:hypothetical protein